MRKVCLTILLIMVMMSSCVTVVNADVDDSAVFSLTTTNTNVKVGDEVIVNLVIDKIEGFSGIKNFAATKVFDSTIFEYIGSEGKNGWEVKADNINIVLRAESHSSSGVIATLKFKVLKSVEDATIGLTYIDASGDDGDVYVGEGEDTDNNVNSPTVSFKVTDVEKPGEDTDTAPGGNTDTAPGGNTDVAPGGNTDVVPGGNKDTTPGENTDNNKVNNDKTTAPGGQIPQTGESYTIVALVAFIVVLAGIFYSKYKMYEEK